MKTSTRLCVHDKSVTFSRISNVWNFMQIQGVTTTWLQVHLAVSKNIFQWDSLRNKSNSPVKLMRFGCSENHVCASQNIPVMFYRLFRNAKYVFYRTFSPIISLRKVLKEPHNKCLICLHPQSSESLQFSARLWTRVVFAHRPCWKKKTTLLGPVFQKLGNAIHRINHYPADSLVCFLNIYPLDSDLSGG